MWFIWPLCAIMAAAQLFGSLYFLMIYQPFALELPHKTVRSTIYLDCYGLEMDGLPRNNYGLIALCDHVVVKRSYYESKFKASFAIYKVSKRGYTCILLPSMPFKIDLTICVDVSSNPGPEKQIKPCEEKGFGNVNYASPCYCESISRIKYGSNDLHNIRFSSLTKYVDRDLYLSLPFAWDFEIIPGMSPRKEISTAKSNRQQWHDVIYSA